MADGKPTQEELVNRILYGSPGVKAAEEAVQAALKSFTDATANEIAVLVKNNILYPEMREGMLNLEKRVVEMTMEAINAVQARIPEPPKAKTKDQS